MKKILFATDFSQDAASAFEFAISLTKQMEGELTIVHTYMTPYVDPATPIAMIDTMYDKIQESNQNQLEKLVATATEIGVNVRSRLVANSVVGGVQEVIDDENIDFLVIGKTGDTGFLTKLLGSNTSDILDDIKTPTFVIPQVKNAITVSNILYATQLEFEERIPLVTVWEIANKTAAELNFVHVEADNEMDIRDDTVFIEDIQSTFPEKPLTLERIKADSVEDGIKAAIHKFDSDLLVLASINRSFFAQLFNAGKAESISHAVNIPTLIFHIDGDS